MVIFMITRKSIMLITKTKVTIICREHGEFEQRPNSHLRGSGCPKCGTILGAISTRKNNDVLFQMLFMFMVIVMIIRKLTILIVQQKQPLYVENMVNLNKHLVII